ncbi:MAG: nucleoside kinase [Clostridia bacterium]|nr:nucleoside kinase [Clostridia bacterium]
MKIKLQEQEFEVCDGKSILETFNIPKDVIAARYNNEIASLKHIIDKDGEISFINRKDRDGRIIYIRGLLYIMSKALIECYPKAMLTVNYQLSNSMFCTIDNMNITDELIKNVKKRMQEIIDKNIEIVKYSMTQEQADEFYEKERTLRGILQTDIDKEKVSLYYCESYYNYFYGTMPISTGFATIYDLEKYKEGFLLKYPSIIEPDKIQSSKESLKLKSALDEYRIINKNLGLVTVHHLNKKIKEGKQKELILFSEALHEKKIAEIADMIKGNPKVKMILIAGPSSSGKTTFAGKLAMALRVNGIKPVTISVDNYFVERSNTPQDELGNYDFEHIDAIDTELLNKHLVALLNGEEIEIPSFDFTMGTKRYLGNKLKLKDDEIIIMEGIHCLNDNLTPLIPKEEKFKVYISDLTVLNIDYYNRISTTDTRLIRRIVRDNKFRNYKALHTLKMWYSVNRGEQRNIFPYQEDADVMFNSSIIYELAVFKDYAIPLLEEIGPENPEYSEARRLITLLKYFESMDGTQIPNNSLIKEFIGGSIFE